MYGEVTRLITFSKSSPSNMPFNLFTAWRWIFYTENLARIWHNKCETRKYLLKFGNLGRHEFHLICSFFLVSVVLEAHSISTVLQIVLGYPLGVIMSSLRCYTRHFSVPTSQINLEPLINIVAASWPRSCFGCNCFKMESAVGNGMTGIQLRRSTYLTIRDWAIFHAKSSLTN